MLSEELLVRIAETQWGRDCSEMAELVEFMELNTVCNAKINNKRWMTFNLSDPCFIDRANINPAVR